MHRAMEQVPRVHLAAGCLADDPVVLVDHVEKLVGIGRRNAVSGGFIAPLSSRLKHPGLAGSLRF